MSEGAPGTIESAYHAIRALEGCWHRISVIRTSHCFFVGSAVAPKTEVELGCLQAWELNQANGTLSMITKRRRAFAEGFKLMEKIGRRFPNTAENKGKCKWTHCPFCRGRLQVWRDTSRGALRLSCSTIGCFAMAE